MSFLDKNGLEYFYGKINDKLNDLHDEIQEINNEEIIKCEKLILPTNIAYVHAGIPYQLPLPVVSPTDTTEPITYVSHDTSIANVSSNGVVTAIDYGIVVIEVSCGVHSQTVTIYADKYLPKNVGMIGFLESVTSSNSFHIYQPSGTSNNKNYILAYLDYPIKPGYSILIECDNSYYSVSKYFIIKTDYTLQVASSGTQTFTNVTLVQTLSPTYAKLATKYTNTSDTDECLMIAFAFNADDSFERTGANEPITGNDELLQAFADRDNVKISMSPPDDGEPTFDEGSNILSISNEKIDEIIAITSPLVGGV